MVYVPEFYIKSWDEPTRRCVRISPTKIDETWEHQPAVYLAAYRDTLLNTVPEDMGYLSTLETNTAVSIANDQPYCREVTTMLLMMYMRMYLEDNLVNAELQVQELTSELGQERLVRR